MALTHYYVRPVNGADVAGQGTTHATAYKTLQFALNDIGATHGRNAVDGDQVNLCSEGTNVNAAALTLATYGTPTATSRLRICGYTSIANDGGMGHINCNVATMWASSAYSAITMINLEIYIASSYILIELTSFITIIGCLIHPGTTNIVNRICIKILGPYSVIYGNTILSYGTGAAAIHLFSIYAQIVGNYIEHGNCCVYQERWVSNVHHNVLRCIGNSLGAQVYQDVFWFHDNVVYADVGSTGKGVSASGNLHHQVYNNVFANFSGAGAAGVSLGTSTYNILGRNAFYNCTTNYIDGGVQIQNDIRASDIVLAADPIVDPASRNFMLTSVAQSALRKMGWPSTTPSNVTDRQITVGAVEYGGIAGAVSLSPYRGNL